MVTVSLLMQDHTQVSKNFSNPHFMDLDTHMGSSKCQENLVRVLSGVLKPTGQFIVAEQQEWPAGFHEGETRDVFRRSGV